MADPSGRRERDEGRLVFGRGVVEYGSTYLGVRRVEAVMRDDLPVVLRIDVIRGGGPREVDLAGPLVPLTDSAGFEAILAGGERVVIRPPVEEDSRWLLDVPVAGLSAYELGRVLGAYDLAAGSGAQPPSSAGGGEFERLVLVMDDEDDHAVGLNFVVRAPGHDDAPYDSFLDVWRVGGEWVPWGTTAGDATSWIVAPGMVDVVIAAVDRHRVIPKAAVMLAGLNPSWATVAGDLFDAAQRGQINPALAREIDDLLHRAGTFGVEAREVDYLAAVPADPSLDAGDLPEVDLRRVFDAITYVTTELDYAELPPFEFAFAVHSGSPRPGGLAGVLAVAVQGKGPVQVEVFPTWSWPGWDIVKASFRAIGEGGSWWDDNFDPVAFDLASLDDARHALGASIAASLRGRAPRQVVGPGEAGQQDRLYVGWRGDGDVEGYWVSHWGRVNDRLAGSMDHFLFPTVFAFDYLGPIDFARFVEIQRRALPTAADWEQLRRSGRDR